MFFPKRLKQVVVKSRIDDDCDDYVDNSDYRDNNIVALLQDKPPLMNHNS